MNICYIANSRFPSERAHMIQIVHMCNAFVFCGNRVTLLATNRATINHDPENYYGTKILFDIKKLNVIDVATGSKYIPQVLRPYIFLLQKLSYVFSFLMYARINQIDLIYGRDEVILFILSFFTKTKIVWESHEGRVNFCARYILNKNFKTIVISEGISKHYQSLGFDSSKLFVAHDAVDDSFFENQFTQCEARKKLGIETKKPVVMYIGGLDKWKGVDTLFKASFDQEIYEVHVIGGTFSEIKEREKLYPKIHFLGQLPYKDLAVNQQAADILVIPNTGRNKLSSEYTSPLKLFAHMTSGKPIIASRIPSLQNIVSENEVWFTEPDDPESLHDTIMKVLKNKELAHTKAERAKEKSKNYRWLIRAKNIEIFVK